MIVRSIAFTLASSGMAATLLECCKTTHDPFNLRLNLIRVETPMCDISEQSTTAQIFVWDDNIMGHKGDFNLTAMIYPDITNVKEKSMDWVYKRAIMTPKNEKVAVIYEALLKLLKRTEMMYTNDAVHYPVS